MSAGTVIIGGGHAGGEAAIQLRRAGYDRPVTVIGEETHPPYERPPLSKDLLSGDMAVEKLFLRPPDYYAKADINIVTARRATAIDRAAKTVALDDGSSLPYEDLIIATGARVRTLDLPGADLAGIHVIRTINDTMGLREELAPGARLALIGGGYIGLEAAAVARKMGAEVTVFEAAPRILSRTSSAPIADFLTARHRLEGVDVRLNQSLSAFAGRDRVSAVVTGDGAEHKADLIIMGVGVLPNVELAEDAGLTVDNGIVVDEFCRTSDPAIYAVGDVSNHPSPLYGGRLRLESVPNAMAQARTVARAITGTEDAYDEVPWFWSNQYDLRLQIAGVAQPGDDPVRRGDPAAGSFSVAHLRDGRLVALEAVNNPRDFMAAKKLIAAKKEVGKDALADPAVALKDLF